MRIGFEFSFPGRGAPTFEPRNRHVGDYPLDLDGSLRYLTPRKGWNTNPNPATYPAGAGIGIVQGFMRQLDAGVYAQMIARLPGGGQSVGGVPADPWRYVPQAVFPGMPQIGSQGAVTQP